MQDQSTSASSSAKLHFVCARDGCEIEFDRFRSQVVGALQFCSRECKKAHQLAQPPKVVTLICTECGEPFETKYAWRDRVKRCPKAECKSGAKKKFHASRRDPISYVECGECGAPLQRPKSRVLANQQFCDESCHTVYQRRLRIEIDCEVCGVLLDRPPSRIRQNPHHVCYECRPAYLATIPKPRGSASHAWQGGKSLEPYTEGWGVWRSREIRQRDGYRCRACHQPGNEDDILVVHHIDGGKDRHDDANLITLHHRCHMAIHKNRFELLFDGDNNKLRK